MVKCYRPKSKLIEYEKTIEEYFRNNPPASLPEASARIEELTGINTRRSYHRIKKRNKKNAK